MKLDSKNLEKACHIVLRAHRRYRHHLESGFRGHIEGHLSNGKLVQLGASSLRSIECPLH